MFPKGCAQGLMVCLSCAGAYGADAGVSESDLPDSARKPKPWEKPAAAPKAAVKPTAAAHAPAPAPADAQPAGESDGCCCFCGIFFFFGVFGFGLVKSHQCLDSPVRRCCISTLSGTSTSTSTSTSTGACCCEALGKAGAHCGCCSAESGTF